MTRGSSFVDPDAFITNRLGLIAFIALIAGLYPSWSGFREIERWVLIPLFGFMAYHCHYLRLRKSAIANLLVLVVFNPFLPLPNDALVIWDLASLVACAVVMNSLGGIGVRLRRAQRLKMDPRELDY